MSFLPRIDRYMLGQTMGIFAAVLAIVMSLMVLEHIPRLFEITKLSGHQFYIIGHTLLGLLPEYGGIGVLVGLYFAVALAIRKLALRGELAVIEATGIGPARWMRVPLVLTLIAALFVLANQGWIRPAGERQVAELGERMQAGEFGFNLAAGEFHEIDSGQVVYFSGIAPEDGELSDLVLFDGDLSYSAARGRLTIGSDGAGIVELVGGKSVDFAEQRVLDFGKLAYHSKVLDQGHSAKDAVPPTDARPLDRLFASPAALDRAAGYGRLLWVLLALLVPVIAFALARPPMRSTSALGLMLGLVILVGLLKSIALVETAIWITPAIDALLLAGFWIVCVWALVVLQFRSGFGVIDHALIHSLRTAQTSLLQRRSA